MRKIISLTLALLLILTMCITGCDSVNNGDVDSTVSSNPMTGFPLAMAYVPYQHFDDLNEPCKALEQGTLFRALYMPFTGRKRSGV